jgi:hypothetical protein
MLGRSGFSACGAVYSIAVLIVGLSTFETASAQGGVVCDYGSTKYRNCCRDSYRSKPGLGARARADDINACMDGRSSPVERRSEEKPKKPDKPDDTPAPRWGAGGRTTSGDLFRRLECATGACDNGCAADELAISAFCNVGSTPALYSDGSIRCANSTGAEWPTAIICAKKQ